MCPASPNRLGAIDVARAIEAGELKCEAVVRACLERIHERNGKVRAFTAVDSEQSIAQARLVDQGGTGFLRGVPFAIKDVIDTKDYPTEYGSPIYRGHRPAGDAACVSVARERGAVVLGKVATSEFATQTPSDTRNPCNLEHTPGGSSSGSAAAVADYMTPVAFGTQTTGSIVRPASYCGVVGYKPTFGLISTSGLKELSHIQDTIGTLARTVKDVAFFTHGLHGVNGLVTSHYRPTLAICRSAQWGEARAEMVEAVEMVAMIAEKAGARVVSITLPREIEDLYKMQGLLFKYEARQSLAYERQHHSMQLSERLKRRLADGIGITPEKYCEMRRKALEGRLGFRELIHGFDALLYPAAQGEAEAGITDSGSPLFGAIWTLLHVPCVCLPVTNGPNHLPLGVQMIGAYGDDMRLLATASFLEDAIKRAR